MMKLYAIISLILISLSSYAQSDSICGIMPSKDGKIYYSEVVNVKDATATQLYSNCKIWIGKTFNDAKSVVQTDVQNSSIVLNCWIKDGEFKNYEVTTTIQFKDGKYKYELFNPIVHIRMTSINIDRPLEELPTVKECKKETLAEINNLFIRFIDSMKNNLKSDW